MKRKISLVFYFLLLILIIPIGVYAAPVGKISHLEGSADITVMGKVRDLRLGDPVSAGDILRTKSKSKVAITFTDGNLLWLAEKSRLRVTQYQPAEGQKSYVNLFRGKTRSVLTNLAKRSSFEVHTPTAVAGARGTVFIGYFENGQSGFVFEEGKGYGYNTAMPERVVTIEAGHSMIVPSPDQPPIVRPATAAEIEKHVKDTQPSAEPAKREETKISDTPPSTPPPPEPPAPPAALNAPPSPPPPPPPPPPVPPTPPAPPTTSTTFSTDVASGGFVGSLSGSINDLTNTGTLLLSGTGTPLYINPVSGEMSDGSIYDSFLSGIPSSWHGLFVGLANKDGSLSFLKGNLDDPNFTEGTLSAAGSVIREPGYSSTGAIGILPNVLLPVIESVHVGSGFSTTVFSNSISGYETETMGLVGIWSVATTDGSYSNYQGLTKWSGIIGIKGYEEGIGPYYSLGDVNVTDDLKGYISISGEDSVLYMDQKYLGLLGLQYRGIYDAEGILRTVGAGTYKLAPLSFSGNVWGGLLHYVQGEQNLIYGGYASGLLGGLGNLLGGTPTSATLMGSFYTNENYTEPALIYGSGWYFGGWTGINTPEQTDDGVFDGYIVGIWNRGKIERAKAIAFYVNTATPSNKAGYLYGNLTGSYYSGINMWTASGDLTATKPGSDTQIQPQSFWDYVSYGHFDGKLAGAGVSANLYQGSSLGFVDQNWGIWNLGMGGKYEGTPAKAKTGGLIRVYMPQSSPYQDGYWLGNVSFNWNDDPLNPNRLSATMTGRFLTDMASGTLSTNYGGMLGTFGGGTWQAAGVGIYENVTPLAFSAKLQGDLFQTYPGKIVTREYMSPNFYSQQSSDYFDPLIYETIFFMKKTAPETYEPVVQDRVFAFEKIDKFYNRYRDEYQYYPNNKWVQIQKGEGITRAVDWGVTDNLYIFPVLYDDPPQSPFFYGNIVPNVNPGVTTFYDYQYVKTSEFEWLNTNALVRNGYFSGIMGVLPGQSLWTSTSASKTGLTFMGEHDPYSGSQIFDTSMSYSQSGIGAFVGNVTGIIRDSSGASVSNPLEGLAIGLYVDNEGKAGILKGNITGFSYKDIGMWESTSASLYRDDIIKDKQTSVTPGNLLERLFVGNIGAGVNSGLYGVLGAAGGYIESPVGLMGHTVSLTKQPCWGYFDMKIGIASTYFNPSSSANSWTGRLFGSGMFGAFSVEYGQYPDSGYFYATLPSGSWADSRIYSGLTGEFLTFKKKGVMEGVLLGTYEGTTAGSWQATAAGTWQKTQDVYFSSEIRGNRYLLATMTSGGAGEYETDDFYHYYILEEKHYGESRWYSPDSNSDTITIFEIKGLPNASKGHKDVWVYNWVAGKKWTFKTTVYDTLEEYFAEMAKIKKHPSTGEDMEWAGTWRTFSLADFTGIMAGLGNIWNTLTPLTKVGYVYLPESTAMIPTPLYMMGDINKFDSSVLDLFSGSVASFDPLVTTDPYQNSKTPVWDGKYGAYIGFLGGSGNTATNSLSVLFRALYLDQNGNIGLFYTDSALSGIFDPGVGMWKAAGNIYSYPMDKFASSYIYFTPENFASEIRKIDLYTNWEIEKELPGVFVNSGSITLGTYDGQYLQLQGPSVYWGIETKALGGSYSGAFPTSWGWIEENLGQGYGTASYLTVYVPEKAGNTFSGNVAGGITNIYLNTATYTEVIGGQIKGVFDPTTSTWKALALSTRMQTDSFFDKINAMGSDTAQRLAFEKATNIPSTEVGKATFTGSGNNLSVTMPDVTFFRFSTETDPRIWAVKNITGTYSNTPSIGTPVNLNSTSGGSLSAQFIPRYWVDGSQWTATVQGQGSLNKTTGGSVNLMFTGGAAGHCWSGSFSGTGAGIVKTTPSPP